LGDSRSSWERLYQVAVKGAEYDSAERQPHPKCLKGTRVDLLDHIHGLLDNGEKSRIIWLHGTAGVGKSAVAFTVAERMKALKVLKKITAEKRLAGSFFFSRKHAKRCITGYFFVTLVCQLASNFPSVREDVNNASRENPALLDPDKSLHDQMEALFLQPLLKLRFRLRDCPPSVFVVDALDECTSKTEVADLISLLGQALSNPDIPVIHILLTSRSEAHIHEAIEEERVRPLVWEIPVKTYGEGVAKIISLDGADVDNDICIFLEQSFRKLRGRDSNFPQPTKDELARLANRAGRRFIVASTMVKFVDDGYNDPRDRLQLLLELTSELPPGTEVYKLYDRILSTCADPKRAYLHLSVVAALADPLPISQISKLLGPGEGRDVEIVLVQLRSVMDIPAGSNLPVNIYHSSIRDYVSDPSNCGLPEVQHMTSPHSLLARSCLRLMMPDITGRANTGLLDALLELKGQSQAMEFDDLGRLKYTLSFIVKPPEPLQVVIYLLWLRGGRGSGLQQWLGDPDGRSWLRTRPGKDWLQTEEAKEWLQTRVGEIWLQTWMGKAWLGTRSGREWLQSGRGWLWAQRWPKVVGDLGKQELFDEPDGLETQGMNQIKTQVEEGLDADFKRDCQSEREQAVERLDEGSKWGSQREPGKPESDTWSVGYWKHKWMQWWLQTQGGREWLWTLGGQEWLRTQDGKEWVRTQDGQKWLRTRGGQEWLRTQDGQEWLQTLDGQEWLRTQDGPEWLQTQGGQEWLQFQGGHEWLRTQDGQKWLQTRGGREWLQTQGGQDWLRTWDGQEWLRTRGGKEWLQEQGGKEWLRTPGGPEWLQTPGGREWLQTPGGCEWLQNEGGEEWLQTQGGREWLKTWYGQEWLHARGGKGWLQTPGGEEWLQTPAGEELLQTLRGNGLLQTWDTQHLLQTLSVQKWLQIQGGQEWLKTRDGQKWLLTWGGQQWLQIQGGQEWLQTLGGREWLQTRGGREWLYTHGGQRWLHTQDGQEWLQTWGGHEWLQTRGGREWLYTRGGQGWLQSHSGQEWLQTWGGHEWLHTRGGQGWLQTVNMRYWLHTQGGQDWLQSPGGRDWLQGPSGRDWMRMVDGQAWQLTAAASIWVIMEDFFSTFEAMNECSISPELLSSAAFQVIQNFKSLPDFLMFPVFLALLHHHNRVPTIPHDLPDIDIIHAMTAFTIFADEAQERSQSASDALKYASQNFVVHLSRAPKPWDASLHHTFKSFWNDHLLSWLERQWCLKGLRFCLAILSAAQQLAKVCTLLFQ